MKKIPFTLEIDKKTYSGYLGTNDQSEPPKTFFVFIDNMIVGDLDCLDGWRFMQKGSHLKQLTQGECNAIAQHLGNIAVEWYE